MTIPSLQGKKKKKMMTSNNYTVLRVKCQVHLSSIQLDKFFKNQEIFSLQDCVKKKRKSVKRARFISHKTSAEMCTWGVILMADFCNLVFTHNVPLLTRNVVSSCFSFHFALLTASCKISILNPPVHFSFVNLGLVT